MQCRIAGLPETSALSKAVAKSSVLSTRSPNPPKFLASAAKSGFPNRVAETVPG